jgi:hypothetical protein
MNINIYFRRCRLCTIDVDKEIEHAKWKRGTSIIGLDTGFELVAGSLEAYRS